jgi:hypothetical protein
MATSIAKVKVSYAYANNKRPEKQKLVRKPIAKDLSKWN